MDDRAERPDDDPPHDPGAALKAPDRRERCRRLGARLAGLDDGALAARLAAVEATRGWGHNRRIALDGVPIFVKSVPLTAIELQRPGSTANHFGLPTFYNYGVGSAGFGAWRELAAQAKTSAWVMAGAVEGFPLLYHHRVLPRSAPPRPLDPEARARYLARWNDDPAIGRCVEARRVATHELVLFLEHIPQNLAGWWPDHPDRSAHVMAELRRTLAFANSRGLLHFDAHVHNILTDGRGVFLADFGLALDADFELSPTERAFFARHRRYDLGQTALGLLVPLAERVKRLPEAERVALAARYGGVDFAALLARLDDLVADDPLALGADYGRLLLEHRAVMDFMARFFAALAPDPRKAAVFDDAALAALLAALPPIDGVPALPGPAPTGDKKDRAAPT